MAPGATGASGARRSPRPGTWRLRALALLMTAPALLQAQGLQPPQAQSPPRLPPAADDVPAMPLPDPASADTVSLPSQLAATPVGPDILPPTPLAPAGFAALDRDRDGSIDVAEAAADPLLADGFGQFDRNADHRLSREEYAAYQPGPADAVGE